MRDGKILGNNPELNISLQENTSTWKVIIKTKHTIQGKRYRHSRISSGHTGSLEPLLEPLLNLFLINLFIYFNFWLCWVFVAAFGLSLVVVSGGYSSLQCAGFSLWWLLLLWSTGSRRVGFSSCGTRA